MRKMPFSAWLMLAGLVALLVVSPGFAEPQVAQQNLTLIVNGRLGGVPIVKMNGRSYVELEDLARAGNGTLGFKGNQVILTLPAPASSTAAAPAASAAANQGFSKEFLRAGIEEMAAIREWRSVLTNAVQRGYPVTDEWLSGYRTQASKNLTLTSVAASTDSDRDAFRLLTSEFDNMQALSDKILGLSKSMVYIAPDALSNDPLDQRILNCAHSLGAMAASGQFQDDGSCH
ncbi:MAG TPA: hypothetical protein VIH76_08855 [Candidatus Acidoferrales bacterium]